MTTTKTCQLNPQHTFTVTDEDRAMLKKLSPIINGKTYPIPEPINCPTCRQTRRLLFRNERHLYHRKCDLTGRALVSNFSSDKPHKVYDQKEWWSDKWNATDYGRDYDFNRPFFEQFQELMSVVPLPHIISATDVSENNCIYTNYAGNNKDCYLVFDSDFNEDCMYGNVIKHSKSCFDCSYVNHSELLYECIDCNNCYNLKYSQDCTNCSDSYFLKNCISCKNCIGCVNLRQKEYCIFNQQYSKEDYEKKLEEFQLGKRSYIEAFEQTFKEYYIQFPHKAFHGVQAENSSGDYLYNTANTKHCFNVGNVKDLSYCDSVYNATDCMDTSSFGEKIQLIYESGTIGINATNILFSHCIVNDSYNVMYSYICRNAHNLFGCVGMNRGNYCVLNKQYTKDEWEELVPKIIEHMRSTGEWGEYFPADLSPFGYNETVAHEKMPLTKEEARAKNLRWKEDEVENSYQGPEVNLPDEISEITPGISSKILKCSQVEKLYKILPQELTFYKKWGIPAPDKCPNARHLNRSKKRNPCKLFDRHCSNCNAPVMTSYHPERPESVLCENCYNLTVT